MLPAIFFLAGLPVAFLLDRAIEELSDASWSANGGLPDEDSVLPWQRGAWPARVRHGVALLAPALMAVAATRFDAPQAVAVSVLVVGLLACTGTDLIRFRVPNVITYPGTALALVAALVMPGGDPVAGLAAALFGGGAFFVMAVITRGGIGLGDVKLAALIGAGLGLPGAYQALVLGVMAGGLVIFVLFVGRVVTRRQGVPYAPFLALAAIAVALLNGTSFAPL